MSPRLDRRTLCDERFLASLEALRITARRVAPRGRFAEQRSRELGAGIEFRDYRPYSPGDDLRRVDWNIHRRLGRLVVRLSEELEDLPLYLLPDISESAWLEEPPRARAGLQCALALAAVSLAQLDRVGLFPWAEDLRVLQRPASGRGRVHPMAELLAGLEPAGRTNLTVSLESFRALGLREGLVCIISDFFDPAGVEAQIEAMRKLRHRLLLVQLVRSTDRDPALSGDWRILDCEGGEPTEVSLTPAVIARYRDAYDRFVESLTEFARSRGAGLVSIDADAEVLPQLAALFEAGVLRV